MSDLNTPPAAQLALAETNSTADYFATQAEQFEDTADMADAHCKKLRELRRNSGKDTQAFDALTLGALALHDLAQVSRARAHTWRLMAKAAEVAA